MNNNENETELKKSPCIIIKGQKIYRDGPPLLIAGPCVLEDLDTALRIAETIKKVAEEYGFIYMFKASFDKANRTSLTSYRGPGLEKGLRLLEEVKIELDVPVISDIHTPHQALPASQVLDCIQIPAFLCRQTDLLIAAARTGKPVNIKKGQFMAPWDMTYAVDKVKNAGNDKIFLTERGSCFGYNNLVVDMRSLVIMSRLDALVIFDATHSVQLPGGGRGCSSGQREFVAPLAKAAMAIGVDGIFMEVHPTPEKALCDGPNSLSLEQAKNLIKELAIIRTSLKEKDQ